MSGIFLLVGTRRVVWFSPLERTRLAGGFPFERVLRMVGAVPLVRMLGAVPLVRTLRMVEAVPLVRMVGDFPLVSVEAVVLVRLASVSLKTEYQSTVYA